LLAWFAWLALHVTVLIGFRNRVSVLLSWIYSYLFFRRGSRLITGLTPEQIADLSSDAIGSANLSPAASQSTVPSSPAAPLEMGTSATGETTSKSRVQRSSPPGG